MPHPARVRDLRRLRRALALLALIAAGALLLGCP